MIPPAPLHLHFRPFDITLLVAPSSASGDFITGKADLDDFVSNLRPGLRTCWNRPELTQGVVDRRGDDETREEVYAFCILSAPNQKEGKKVGVVGI